MSKSEASPHTPLPRPHHDRVLTYVHPAQAVENVGNDPAQLAAYLVQQLNDYHGRDHAGYATEALRQTFEALALKSEMRRSDPPRRLLAAYTPERYEGEYPPYFNITQVGSMVQLAMRGSRGVEDSAVATVNAWTFGKIAEAFREASGRFECGFDTPPESMS